MQQQLTIEDLIQTGANLQVLKAPTDGRIVMDGHLGIKEVAPGFWASNADCKAKEDLTLIEETDAYITFNICISGSRHFNVNGKDADPLIAKQLNTLFSPERTNIGEAWQSGQKTKTLGLIFDKSFMHQLEYEDEYLRKALKKLERHKGFFQTQTASLELMHIAQQINYSPGQGILSHLYYKGLGIAFIAEYFGKNFDVPKNEINQEDVVRRKILDLKHELSQNPMMSINLNKIARSMGISERKLRAEFLMLFGSSITDFIRILRLDRAHEMLEEGNSSIDEVAYQCGYSNTPNFSNAFKRKFNYTPATVRSL